MWGWPLPQKLTWEITQNKGQSSVAIAARPQQCLCLGSRVLPGLFLGVTLTFVHGVLHV